MAAGAGAVPATARHPDQEPGSRDRRPARQPRRRPHLHFATRPGRRAPPPACRSWSRPHRPRTRRRSRSALPFRGGRDGPRPAGDSPADRPHHNKWSRSSRRTRAEPPDGRQPGCERDLWRGARPAAMSSWHHRIGEALPFRRCRRG